jgi:hypothetical protein
MGLNVKEMSLAELWEVVEEIQNEDEEFETCEKSLRADVHKWYTGEDLELELEIDELSEMMEEMDVMTIEEKMLKYKKPEEWGCECFCEYDPRRNMTMINPNHACKTCMYIYENRIGKDVRWWCQ